MKMKLSAAIALALCPVLFLTSCVYEYPAYSGGAYYGGGGYYGVDGYGYASNPYIYSAGVSAAWTPASYDADGFPIYGYSYGRPVYGYTEAGVAIFTLAAITAACLVPRWEPAPWYHGHWHYPHGCHRVDAPHHYPHGHCPGVRPHGGINAPIHREMMRHVMEGNKRIIRAEQNVIKTQAKAVQNVAKAQQKMAGAQYQATKNMAEAQQKMIAKQAKANIEMQQRMMGIKPKAKETPAPQINQSNAAHNAAGQFRPVTQSPLQNNAAKPGNRGSISAPISARPAAPAFHASRAAAAAPSFSKGNHSAAAPAGGGMHGRAFGGGGFGAHHKR